MSMFRRGHLFLAVLGLATNVQMASWSYAAASGISLWTRHSGSYSDDQNPTKSKTQVFEFAPGKLVQRRMLDVQYGYTANYRGRPLVEVIASYKHAANDDLALLHFANGMIVPVPLDEADIKRLDAFVAVEVCPKKGACSGDFSEVAKEDAYSVTGDPRPITFTWNKIVVPTLWHPEVPEARQHIFTPWHHVDTLTGIEFVNSAAYYRQFDLAEAEGLSVFRQRCQYCHSARYVGSRYGWDFVTPLPIFEKRPPEQLLNHVKYPKTMAKRMGLMMPNQSDVTEPEMKAIWRWMKKAASRPLPSYKP